MHTRNKLVLIPLILCYLQDISPAMLALTQATEAPLNLKARYKRVFAEGIAELICNQVVEIVPPIEDDSGRTSEVGEEAGCDQVSKFASSSGCKRSNYR